MWSDFKEFLGKHNVIAFAVAFIMAAAVGAVLNSFVTDIVMPLLGLVGLPDMSELTVDVGSATMNVGLFLNALISFIAIGLVMFYFAKFGDKIMPPDEPDPGPSEVDLLAEIRDALKQR